MKKIYIFLIIVTLIILSYLIILYIPKNYTLDYAIDKVKILEKFNKKLNQYSFILTYEDQEYPFFLETTLHFRFYNKKIMNEWFLLSFDDVINFKKTCKEIEDMIDDLKDNPFFKKNLK